MENAKKWWSLIAYERQIITDNLAAIVLSQSDVEVVVRG
jgi:hypothetical protein